MTSPRESDSPATRQDATAPRALSLRTRIAIPLGAWLLRVLGATWRLRVEGAEGLQALHHAGRRAIIVVWHGQMLPAVYAHRTPIRVLTSEHGDGEIIARVMATFGHGAVRGSSSRGGARALLECAAVLKGGTDIAITPDGPRGPRHSFAPGALVLAHRTGVPLVAIVAHAERAWRLHSWDGFEIPKPFSRVTVRYSAPRGIVASDVRDASAQADEYAAWLRAELQQVQTGAAAA